MTLNHGIVSEQLALNTVGVMSVCHPSDGHPSDDLERAKRTLEMSSAAHYNFGCNVEARKRHHRSINDAVAVLEDAGYKARRARYGYELEAIQ